MPVLRLAIPCPLRRSFDYLPPADCDPASLTPGQRVTAPFGRRALVGVLLEVADHSELPATQLKTATAVLDAEPAVPSPLYELVLWAADYYQHPVGECLHHSLPALLRRGDPMSPQQRCWRLTREGHGLPEGALKRARKQAQALALLQQGEQVEAALEAEGLGRNILRELEKKGLAEAFEIAEPEPQPFEYGSQAVSEQPLQLTGEQRAAVAEVIAALGAAGAFLLEGITGSGKTEVYLHLIQQCLERGEQVLVLVPEIGLTPQTLARFQRRFGDHVAVLHSGLSDGERLQAWRAARSGAAPIVLGTRSAIFTPFRKLGLIVVDEEHDGSFKQQEGFRYSARDLAVMRGHLERCPVLLGSATPSLETLHNALSGRYGHLRLSQRTGAANPPSIDLVDIRRVQLDEGFSPEVLIAIEKTLERGEQVLAFINRRGFAPSLLCHDCGWVGQCRHCDARLTVHLGSNQLRCHHCEYLEPLPRRCPHCKSSRLDFRGPGSERCERALNRHFSHVPVIRIDRDTTQGKTALADKLGQARAGGPCILVGTQMLAKGHHLPAVTLVAIIDIDSALFSPDFRGPERMAQLIEQVAGRAGRADKPGRVLIQTHHPEHPLLGELIDRGYGHSARRLLSERQSAGLPPFSYQALLRAEGNDLSRAEAFLRDLRKTLADAPGISLLGPLPAPMARRAGRFRAQLLLTAPSRRALQAQLGRLCQLAEQHPDGNKLRWALDVDPIEAF